MPWRSSSPMDLRMQFIADYLREMFTISELSREYQISRKTAYKWIDRYELDSAAALADRSRRPHQFPRATAAAQVKALLTLRQRHPYWGAEKLLKLLADEQPEIKSPLAPLPATYLRVITSSVSAAGVGSLVMLVNPLP